jgi:hypothetical protein
MLGSYASGQPLQRVAACCWLWLAALLPMVAAAGLLLAAGWLLT